MRFEVLGHLRAGNAGPTGEPENVALGGPKQQAVLAFLLADPNRTVSTDALVDGLWGDAPPTSARHTVQGYVSELRRVVGDVIQRDSNGYVARVDASSLDALEFEALISEGQSLLGVDVEAASERFRAALDLWRGTPFGEFDDSGPLGVERRRLEELRLTALEDRIDADLGLGRQAELAGELDILTAEHPYREKLRAQQMLALYRAGRQADALRAYQRSRAVLADELGIEPSPQLRRLEEQILVQDPALDLAVPLDDVDPTGPVYNPYKGLRPFTEEDAEDFFGRDDLLEELESAVAGGSSLVALVGPSGSGKSSLMRAGLAPAVRSRPPDGTTWIVATMSPGAHPYTELEAALLRALDEPPATLIDELTDGETGLLRIVLRLLRTDGERLLLLIDQFEELFTLVDAERRDDFLASIVAAADDPRGRVRLVITLRADFYDRPLMHPGIARLLTGNVINVTPLDGDSLEAAAVGPASRMGVGFEPGLLAALVTDVAGQPNALPLFQYTLTELFDRRDDSLLTLAAYRELGGLRRAVAVGAEETYENLDAGERGAALQLFLRLVAVGEATATRRRVTAAELLSLEVDVVAMQAAMEAFASHRLLTLDRDPLSRAPVVEVAHEALLTEWDRLHTWINENRESLRRYPSLAGAVEEWLTSGRDPDYLLTAGRLHDYEQWRLSCPMLLTAAERHYLDDAAARRDAALAEEAARDLEQHRLRRRARRTTIALVGLLVAAAATATALILTSGGDSTLTVAAIAPAGERDDNQVGELFDQGLERAGQDYDVHIERFDVLLSPEDLAGQLNTDLVFLDSETSSTLFFTDQVHLLKGDSHYVMYVDGWPAPDLPNITMASWRDQEAGFLAGVAASATSRSGVVGYLGASFPNERFRAGFEAGARRVDPGVRVVAAQIGDFGEPQPWDNEDAGRKIARRLYEEGADVVFHAAGRSGFGVFEAAADMSTPGLQLWAIGVDTDQWQTASEAERNHVLTSIVKRVDQDAYEIVGEFVEGTLAPGVRELGVADGMIEFSRSGGHLDGDAIAELEAAKRSISEGEIDVPTFATGPLIGPDPVHDVVITFDGQACRSEGPRVTPLGEPVGFRFVNDTEAFASLVLVGETEPHFVDVPADGGAEVLRSAVLPGGRYSVSVFDPTTDVDEPCGRLLVE